MSSVTLYHVTSRENIAGICETGLIPGDEVGKANFSYPRLSNCVYAWPTMAQALTYIESDIQKFGKDNHVILSIEVSGFDLFPDHEEFLRFLIEDEVYTDHPWNEIRELQADRSKTNNETHSSCRLGNGDFKAAIEIIENLPDDLRLRAAESLLRQGEAVAVRSGAPIEGAAVMEMQDIDMLLDKFSFEYPHLDDTKDEWFDEFDAWISHYHPITKEELFDKLGSSPIDYVDGGDVDIHFSPKPIEEWAKMHRLLPPELEPVRSLDSMKLPASQRPEADEPGIASPEHPL